MAPQGATAPLGTVNGTPVGNHCYRML